MGEVVSMQVPEKVIAEIVQSQVAARVVEALKGQDAFVSKIVDVAFSLKVDTDGKPCSYSSAKPYIEYICIKAIQEAAKEAVNAYVIESKEAIKKEITKQLKKSTSRLVQSFFDSVLSASQCNYRMKIDVKTEKDNGD